MATNKNTKTKSKLALQRVNSNITQLQMAVKLGYSPSYYAMIEREPSFLSEEIAAKAAKILGVAVRDIK